MDFFLLSRQNGPASIEWKMIENCGKYIKIDQNSMFPNIRAHRAAKKASSALLGLERQLGRTV